MTKKIEKKKKPVSGNPRPSAGKPSWLSFFVWLLESSIPAGHPGLVSKRSDCAACSIGSARASVSLFRPDSSQQDDRLAHDRLLIHGAQPKSSAEGKSARAGAAGTIRTKFACSPGIWSTQRTCFLLLRGWGRGTSLSSWESPEREKPRLLGTLPARPLTIGTPTYPGPAHTLPTLRAPDSLTGRSPST